MITQEPKPGERVEFSEHGQTWEYAGTVVRCEGKICHLHNETLPFPQSQRYYQGSACRLLSNINSGFIWQHADGTFNKMHRVVP